MTEQTDPDIFASRWEEIEKIWNEIPIKKENFIDITHRGNNYYFNRVTSDLYRSGDFIEFRSAFDMPQTLQTRIFLGGVERVAALLDQKGVVLRNPRPPESLL